MGTSLPAMLWSRAQAISIGIGGLTLLWRYIAAAERRAAAPSPRGTWP